MPNTFNTVPDAHQERSTAFLAVESPEEQLEALMEEAQLHRGSLREVDGYTIPFREGGHVRVQVREDEARGGGLQFEVRAPSAERRAYIEEVIEDQASSQFGDGASLDWQRG